MKGVVVPEAGPPVTAVPDGMDAGSVSTDPQNFAMAGGIAFVGALSGSVPVLAVSILLAVYFVGRRVEHGGLLAALAVALVWSNVVLVAANDLGLPVTLALAPVGILAWLLAQRVVLGRTEIVLTPGFRALLLFGAAVLASGIVAADQGPVLDRYQTFLVEGVLLWFLLSNTVVRRRAVERALSALVIAAALLGAITVFQYASHTFTKDYAGLAQIEPAQLDLYAVSAGYLPRLGGSIGEKNRFGQVLAVSLPIAVALARRRDKKSSIIYHGAAVCILGGIVVSGSRGAAIGVLATVVVLVAYRLISFRSIVVVAALAGGALLLMPGYRDRIASSFQGVDAIEGSSQVDTSIQSRLTENLSALHMYFDYPVLGIGPDGYPSHYEVYAKPIGLRVKDEAREPHDLYLGIAAELGTVGLFAFLFVVATVLVRLHRGRRVSVGSDVRLADVQAGMIAAVVAYLATGVFLHLSFERYLWLLLALADVAASVSVRSGSPLTSATRTTESL